MLSNEEAGSGRLDIVIRPRKMTKKVIIIECKHARNEDALISESKQAINRLKRNDIWKNLHIKCMVES